MTPRDLQDHQTVTVRTGRAGLRGVEWSSWHTAELYVQTRPKDLTRAYRRQLYGAASDYWHAGDPCVITLRSENWAEAGMQDFVPPSDDNPNGGFIVEDWYLEIEGLTA